MEIKIKKDLPRALSLSITAIFFISLSNIIVAQQNTWLKTEIDKIIRFDTEINYKDVPGFIIGIIDGDSTYFYSFGTRETRKNSGQLNKHDIFEIGSVSKLYTAQVVRVLDKEGKLSLNDEVNNYLPGKYRNPRLNHLTVKDLLNHQSGFSLRPEMFGARELDSQNPYLYYNRENLLYYYYNYIPETNGFIYSHTNYAILEEIIQQVTGLDYNDVVYEYINKTCNLTNTFVDFPEQKENYIAPGYDKYRKKVKPWTFSSFRASEGIKTSADDAVLFIKFLLFQNDLNPAAMEVIVAKEDKPDKSFNKQLYIENGWNIITVKGKKVSVHTGRTSGHSCFMGMVKDTKTAVIVMSNSWIGTEDLGMQILRLINQNWKF